MVYLCLCTVQLSVQSTHAIILLLFFLLPVGPSSNGQSWLTFESTECAHVRSNTGMFLHKNYLRVPKSTDLLISPVKWGHYCRQQWLLTCLTIICNRLYSLISSAENRPITWLMKFDKLHAGDVLDSGIHGYQIWSHPSETERCGLQVSRFEKVGKKARCLLAEVCDVDKWHVSAHFFWKITW